jgi:hypothetical protein
MTKLLLLLTASLALAFQSHADPSPHPGLLRLSNKKLHFIVSAPFDWKTDHPVPALVLKDASSIRLVRQYGGELIPGLVGLLKNDRKRDWAATVLLYALTQRSAAIFTRYKKQPTLWEKEQQPAEEAYWTRFLATSRADQLHCYQLTGHMHPVLFAIDAKDYDTRDSIELTCRIRMTKELTARQVLTVLPHQTVLETVPLPAYTPILGAGNFYVGDGDSMHITCYNGKSPVIDGARFPADYKLEAMLDPPHSETFPDIRSGESEKYVKRQDATTMYNIDKITTALTQGQISPEVANTLYHYLLFKHMFNVVLFDQRGSLSATYSELTPVIDMAHLQNDLYADIFYQAAAIEVYLHHEVPSRYKQFPIPSFAETNMAIDSCSGAIRLRVLYDYIFEKGLHPFPYDSTAAEALFHRIERLPLPAPFDTLFNWRYRQFRLEQHPIPDTILRQTVLTRPDGSTIDLAAVLDSCPKQAVFLYLRKTDKSYYYDPGKKGPAPDTRSYRTITLDIYDDANSWREMLKGRYVPADEYFLAGNPDQPLTRYFLVHTPVLQTVELTAHREVVIANMTSGEWFAHRMRR